jgi:hypothetical protein
MSRFTFAALASVVLSSAAAAQQVPGRDLLEFPLGLLAEPPALSARMPASLWNPAVSVLSPGSRGSIGFAGLTTPEQQGVDLEMLGGEVRFRGMTASLSYAQAGVNDILRTDTDPTTVTGSVPYQTNLFSLGAATARGPYSIGAAARIRTSRFDNDHSSVFSFDVGALANSVLGTPLRVAASTFLFSPSRAREAALYTAAADYPLFRRDTSVVIRGGYSVSHTEGRGREDYVFGTTTYRELDASVGVAQLNAFGHADHRLRIGIGLHHAGYNIAFGREDGNGGIAASYQVLLTRTFR